LNLLDLNKKHIFILSKDQIMNILGNVIWLLFGGLVIAFEYLVSSIILCITIIGIPFGLQTLKLAGLALVPFGKEIRQNEYAGGCLSTLMNLLWLLCGGIWICLSHLVFGILFCITIIGIPFGIQHFKLASLALTPFGREIIIK
jgi:uncharacterized membrane protein YccF (DUF307 family)